MDPLEAVADAIMRFEGWTPGTLSYKHRNPGNLESVPGTYNTYASLVEGYSALLADLREKFLGHTKTGLGPDSTLIQLMMKYAPPSDHNPTLAYTKFICDWIEKSLGITCTEQTKLKEIWHP